MHDLAIIGAGPAGLAAALYAGRFRLNTLILEKVSAGGQIILSSEIENYPGFPGGISTFELVERFKKQVDDLGLAIENTEVSEVRQNNGTFDIVTKEKSYQAQSVIIATGARPRRLGVPGEERLTGRGVSYCGTCDGPLFRDKEIVVIGGGDRAVEEAIFLSGYASKMYLVHRRSEFRASAILTEKIRSNPKITLLLDSALEEITGEKTVEKAGIKNLKSGVVSQIACLGVFIFVGIEPNTGFLKNSLEMNEKGFIITDQEMSTGKKGLFACGDCRSKSLYQVVTACAEGAIAADSAHKYLLNK